MMQETKDEMKIQIILEFVINPNQGNNLFAVQCFSLKHFKNQ